MVMFGVAAKAAIFAGPADGKLLVQILIRYASGAPGDLDGRKPKTFKR